MIQKKEEMKHQKSKFHTRFCVLLLFVSFAALTNGVLGQNATDKSSVPAPSEEKFEPGGDFAVVNWYDSGCPVGNYKFESGVDCEESPRWNHTQQLHLLYDRNGKIWNEISRNPQNPKHPSLAKKEGFKPVGMFLGEWGRVVLRLVAVSEHWYEVEVNYKTRETIYAPRFGEMWRAVSWCLVLQKHEMIVDNPEVKFLDAIDGKPVAEFDGQSELELSVDVIEGDWARVMLRRDEKLLYGWVRWRDGRKFLVKFSLGTELYSG
ncbi:MAG: hypothetical protein KF762_07690 [Acidobacteria bacterium]|nr:hypothetical protein [Acidobacteriota bacterium]